MDNARLILKLSTQEANALTELIDTHLDMQAGGMLADLLADCAEQPIQDRYLSQGKLINQVIELGVLQGRLLQMLGK